MNRTTTRARTTIRARSTLAIGLAGVPLGVACGPSTDEPDQVDSPARFQDPLFGEFGFISRFTKGGTLNRAIRPVAEQGWSSSRRQATRAVGDSSTGSASTCWSSTPPDGATSEIGAGIVDAAGALGS